MQDFRLAFTLVAYAAVAYLHFTVFKNLKRREEDLKVANANPGPCKDIWDKLAYMGEIIFFLFIGYSFWSLIILPYFEYFIDKLST